jgi:hypothetical protein
MLFDLENLQKINYSMNLNHFIFEKISDLLQMLHLQFLIFDHYFINLVDPTAFLGFEFLIIMYAVFDYMILKYFLFYYD